MYSKVRIKKAINPITDIKNTQTFFILTCTKADTNTRIIKIQIIEPHNLLIVSASGSGAAMLNIGPIPRRATNMSIIPCTK